MKILEDMKVTPTIPTVTTQTTTNDDADNNNHRYATVSKIDALLATPVGTFTNNDYTLARDYYYFLTTTTTTTTAGTTMTERNFQKEPPYPSAAGIIHIGIGLRLYERLLQEVRHHQQSPQSQSNSSSSSRTSSFIRSSNTDDALAREQMKWIYDPYQTIVPLLKTWKQQQAQSISLIRHNNNVQPTKKGNQQPPESQYEAMATTTSAADIIATLQRCEGLHLIATKSQEQPPVVHYYWTNPIIVPLVFEMSLLPSSSSSPSNTTDSPIHAERFLSFVIRRHQQREQQEGEIGGGGDDRNTDSTSGSTTSINDLSSKQQQQQQTMMNCAPMKTKTRKHVTATEKYQFPNETMCRQLLHAWMNYATTTTTTSNKNSSSGSRQAAVNEKKQSGSSNNNNNNKATDINIAISHVQTLMQRMQEQYDMVPTIQFYNGLLKLHAQQSSYYSGSMLSPSSSSSSGSDIATTTTDRNHHNKSNVIMQYQVGSGMGREHRNKIDTILQTIIKLQQRQERIQQHEHYEKPDVPVVVIQPTLETWYQAIVCYSNWNCFYDAKDTFFQKMIPLVVNMNKINGNNNQNKKNNNSNNSSGISPTTIDMNATSNDGDNNNNNNINNNNSAVQIVDMAGHHIVLGYRRLMYLPSNSKRSTIVITKQQKQDVLQRLTKFIDLVQQLPPGTLSPQGLEQIYGTVMDVYAREGELKLVESLLATIESPNMVYYCLLIKAYGTHRRPEGGEEVLFRLLEQPEADGRVQPTIEAFNILINAWAINTPYQPNAPNRARATINFMDHNVQCIQMGVRPDTVSYNTFLKCVAVATAPSQPTMISSNGTPDNASSLQRPPITDNMEQYVQDVLNEMEERYKAGNRSVLPDIITYNVAIQCCTNAGNIEGAQKLLQRMIDSRVRPNIRTYNILLIMYAQIGTIESAQSAEDLVFSLRQTTKVEPDAYSFNHIFKAWSRSGDPGLYDRIWMIYQRMRSNEFRIHPDMVMYTCLISSLSNSPNIKHILYATTILDEMEEKHCFDTQLRPDNRHYIPIVTAYLNYSDNNETNDETPDHHATINTAAKIFIRFVDSYVRGRTGYDAPKQETVHAIVQRYIQTGNLFDGVLFLEQMESYYKPTTTNAENKHTARRLYKTLPMVPVVTAGYRDLETALLLASQPPPPANNTPTNENTTTNNDEHRTKNSSDNNSGHYQEQIEYYLSKLRTNLKLLLN